MNIGESKKSWASTETPPIDSHCLALPFGLVEKVNGYESIWMAIWIYMDVCLYVCIDQMALQQWGHKWTQWCNGLQMFTDVYRMLGCTARLQTTHPSANSFNIHEPSSPHLICSVKIQSISVSLVHLLTLKQTRVAMEIVLIDPPHCPLSLLPCTVPFNPLFFHPFILSLFPFLLPSFPPSSPSSPPWFPPSFPSSFTTSFPPSFLPSFPPSLLPSLRPSFLPSFPPSLLPSFLLSFPPSFLPFLLP